MRLLEGRTEVARIELQVCARALEARVIEEPAELMRRKSGQACGLHFAEAGLLDHAQRRRGMRLQFILDRIQLDSDGSAERSGTQAAGRSVCEDRGNAPSGGPREKAPAGERCHRACVHRWTFTRRCWRSG